MSQKFLIVVIAITLYNGVTYSLNVKRNSDVGLPEEKPPTVLPVASDHINKTVEPIPVPDGKANVSSQQNTSSNLKNGMIQPSVNNETTTADSVVHSKGMEGSEKNNTKISDNKNVSETTEKINHQTTGKSNINQAIDNKSVNQSSSNKNTEVPSVNHSVAVTTPPPEQRPTVAPTPITSLSSNNNSLNVTIALPVSTTTPHSLAKDNTPASAQASSGFDGPSFIGGIVLTLGVTAIGFVAFKYYKSGKIDMNYRTL